MMQYDNLPGRSRENAQKALDLAVERGFRPEDVRTTRDGYQIPVAADETESLTGAVTPEDDEKKPAKKTARTRTKKKE